jgi:hypothetical protein
MNYLPRLASSQDPPNLCLLIIQGYRHEPQVLSKVFYLKKKKKKVVQILILLFFVIVKPIIPATKKR